MTRAEAWKRTLAEQAAGSPRSVAAPQAETPATRRPPLVWLAPPSTFSDDWGAKPSEPVEMGMRLVGENTLRAAQVMAARAAWEGHPHEGDGQRRIDLYNSELMSNVLARALVAANDRTTLFFPETPEDTCRVALSSGGLRALWERYERLALGSSPLSPEATDDELARLAAAIADGAVGDVAGARQRRIRRLARALLAELENPTP